MPQYVLGSVHPMIDWHSHCITTTKETYFVWSEACYVVSHVGKVVTLSACIAILGWGTLDRKGKPIPEHGSMPFEWITDPCRVEGSQGNHLITKCLVVSLKDGIILGWQVRHSAGAVALLTMVRVGHMNSFCFCHHGFISLMRWGGVGEDRDQLTSHDQFIGPLGYLTPLLQQMFSGTHNVQY